MRKLLSCVVVLLALTAPVKAEALLTKQDKSFVVNMVGGAIMTSECGAKAVPGGMHRFADKIGVDGDRLIAAVDAAAHAQVNEPYERENLISAVTRLMLDTENAITEGLQRDKVKTCASFMKTLRENGVIE